MPVLTRSNPTGPTRMITGIKRKFIEILDSDDDTSIESEFEADSNDEIEDDIEALKDDLKETEQTNDALINMLVKERERVAELTKDLADANYRIDTLRDSICDLQNTTFIELVCFITVIGATLGTTLSALYVCNSDHLYLTI